MTEKPHKIQTYGNFYGINHLLDYHKIRMTNCIERFVKTDIRTSDLTKRFNEKELKQIRPLINLALINKNQKSINDIIKEKILKH